MSLSLSIDEAGLLLAEAVQVMGTLEAYGAQERLSSEPLPRGLLTCGEAVRLIPAVIAIVAELYPTLLDPGVLEQVLRVAALADTHGEPN